MNLLENENDKIPFLKSWKQWYVFVIAFLMLLIILFSLFTNKFS